MNLFSSYYAQAGNFTAETRIPYATPLLEAVDRLRLEVGGKLNRQRQSEMGQFFTPASIAGLMATMMSLDIPEVRLLDAGAGIGTLFAACIAALCCKTKPPRSIHITAYEADPLLQGYLQAITDLCRQECKRTGVKLTVDVHAVDFIEEAVNFLCGDLFAPSLPRFNAAILNPPYRKIHSESPHRQRLRKVGVETTNLYTGFLALAIQLLDDKGEMVAITPRSFCNGTYFRAFRRLLLEKMALNRIHLFDSRQEAFQDDSVLQETIIIHAVKGVSRPEQVVVTSSKGMEDDLILCAERSYNNVVALNDPEQFIHVVSDEIDARIVDRMSCLHSTLHDLGLTVSTGRVVDFRAEPYLKAQPECDTAPLLYPTNLDNGIVAWPQQTRKPQALAICKETETLFVPNETYVLVKRFSSKEERRRVVAAICEEGYLPGDYLGFENHLNYFHRNGRGVDLSLARGLSLFLNSTLLDTYFRQFSGHTQVNATDLRNLKYPTSGQLRAIGSHCSSVLPIQEEIDIIIQQELFGMSEDQGDDPVLSKNRIAKMRTDRYLVIPHRSACSNGIMASIGM
jgi:adenine-specific DNA-methyltransferase